MSSKSTISGLQMIRALLSDESRFCKAALAEDTQGFRCLPTNKDACKWCLLGALEKVAWGSATDDLDQNYRAEMLRALMASARGMSVYQALNTINDYQGWAMVLKIVDGAISAEQEKSG